MNSSAAGSLRRPVTNKNTRRWIVAGAGVVVVLVVLMVSLKVYFTPDRLRTLVVPVLTEQLHRPVEIGSLRLGVWGGLHVSLEQLRVADRPGFGAAPFLSVEHASLSVAFWPLLSGEVAIGEVKLVGPRVSVVINADGLSNYSDLTEQDSTASAAESTGSLRLDRVNVQDGIVQYSDLTQDTNLELGGIAYDLELVIGASDLLLSGDLTVGSMRWQGTGEVDTLDTGSLRLQHRLRQQEDLWLVESLDLAWGPVGLTASGQIRPTADGVHLDLRVDEPRLNLGSKQIHALLGEGMELSGIATIQLEIAGPLNAAAIPPVYPDLSSMVTLSSVVVTLADLPEPVRIDTAALLLSKGVLQLAVFEGHALSQLSGSGRIEPVWPPGDERMKLRLDVRADSIRVPESGPEPTAATPASAGLPGWLGVIDAQVVVSANLLQGAGVDARDLRMDLRLTEGQLQIAELRGRMYGGLVRMSGQLDSAPTSGPYPVQAQLEIQGLHLAAALSGQLDPGVEADGILSMSARVRGSLDETLQPVLSRGAYAVSGKVALAQGKIRMPDLLLPVEGLTASVSLAQGDQLTLENLSLKAGASDLTMTGRAEGILDHLLQPTSAKRPTGKISVSGTLLDLDALFVDPAYLPSDSDQTSALLPLARVADGEATLSFGAVISDTLRYADLWAHAVATAGVIRVDSLRAHAMGGRLTAQAEIDARRPAGDVPLRASAAFTGIRAQALLKDFMGWKIPLFGQMGTSVVLSAMMDSTLTVIDSTLVVDGDAWAQEGRLVNWPFLTTAGASIPQLGFLNFSDLALRDLLTGFRMARERVFLKDMNFTTGDVGCALQGSVGLDATIDVRIDANLPAKRLAAQAQRFGLDRIPGLKLDEQTRIPLGIQIAGTADKPRIEAQLQPGAAERVQGVQQELKEKAKQKARAALRSLF